MRWLTAAALLALVLAAALLRLSREPDGLGGVPALTYRQVTLGIDAEALVERLRPAQPVRAQSGEPVAAEPGALTDGCLHYESAGAPDLLYRFCFEDDRLVRKDERPRP